MDLSGTTIGNLKILSKHPQKAHNSLWVCECLLCGSLTIKSRPNIRHGLQDCGCQKARKMSERMRIHGDSHAKGTLGYEIYKKWMQMRRRCKDPSKPYLKRGIGVCKEWETYEVFKTWAIETKVDPKLELDRIDNDKGYSPDNCRWVTHKENCRNKRHPLSRPVINERGEKFPSGQQASSAYGVHRDSVTRAAKTGYRCAGMKWYFLDEAKTTVDSTKRVV